MSDNRIAYAINEFFRVRRLPGVHHVWAEVYNGVAVLRGSVNSHYTKWSCYECARRVTGVLRVHDELQLS